MVLSVSLRSVLLCVALFSSLSVRARRRAGASLSRGSSRRVRSASAQSSSLSLASAAQLGGDGPLSADGACFDLPKKMCEACPSGETNMCQSTKKACARSFCTPLCTKNISWSCDIGVTGTAFNASLQERKALCAQVIGHACSETFKCCKADAALTAWVERRSTCRLTATPLLPLAACIHDASDKAAATRSCNACKAALSLKVAAKIASTDCAFGSAPMARGDSPTPGAGSLTSLEERCAAQALKINDGLAKLISSINAEKLCECSGCCDTEGKEPTCWFPAFEVIR